jgi:molybdopterin synthase sulfur carrier subunit
MVTVTFAKAFRRHVDCPDEHVNAADVGDALTAYFGRHPGVRTYVLDDEGHLRRHVTVFVGADQLDHRRGLTAAVPDGGTISIFQALSGG